MLLCLPQQERPLGGHAGRNSQNQQQINNKSTTNQQQINNKSTTRTKKISKISKRIWS
jgi:hypothetical protein